MGCNALSIQGVIMFFKNIIIKMSIRYILSEITQAESNHPEIREFREALYNKSVNQFMKWGMEKLEGSSLDTLSPIQLVMLKIEPLRDDFEAVIVKILNGLNPSK